MKNLAQQAPATVSYSDSLFLPIPNIYKLVITKQKCGLQDEKLKGEKLDPRLEIAVGIRQGEKKVLQQIDEIFKDRESELNELEYYQERRLKDLGLCGEQGEIIFWEPK